MIPTIYDIAVKDIKTIDIEETLGEAIKQMVSSNLRTIVIIDDHKYHILTTSLLIDYKLAEIKSDVKLKELNLPPAKTLNKDLNILNVLNQLNTSCEYMVLLDKQKELVGIISYTDIINNIDPQVLMKRQTIGTLILNYRIITIYEDASTLYAIKRMKKSGNDAVIITNQEEKPIGIFTTKDFISLIHENTNLNETINKYMTKPIVTLNHKSTISDALDFIKEKKFKRIVIVDDNNNVTGIIAQKELLRIVYNKWVDFVRSEGDRISKTNEQLLEKKSQLEEIASIDFLTQIYNRQKFDSFLEYEIQKLNRYNNETFSVLLIDLDHFKIINDTYGHLKGDMVLQEVAKILTLCSRTSDVVARWGGEEFVMLLSHTNIEEASFVAQKFISTVQRHRYEDNITVTCSVGVAQFHLHDSKDSIFKRADDALYNAKKLGRNRVELEYINELQN